MAPIFLCACLRIIRERGAKKGSGRDGRKPKTAVVGSAKVGRAKMGRPKLRVAERANIGKRILVETGAIGNYQEEAGDWRWPQSRNDWDADDRDADDRSCSRLD